ncbi:glycosyltransferase [Streptomyces sp. NPDC088116]|uniref:glycosyltransferase n=1 Tax=Streptomyces sp. NPDC088116 TaxID=3365825 RepID=UPI0038044D96
MKALIYTHGTRGDLQPYLALACALDRAGHTATLVAPGMFAPFAAEYGIRLEPLTDAGVRLNERPDVRKLLQNNDRSEAGGHAYRQAREKIFNEVMPRIYPVMLRQLWNAAREGADIVLHSHHSRQVIHQIAEKLGVPHALATLYPHFTPSRRYPREMGSFDARPDNLQRHTAADSVPLKPMLADMISTWRSDTLGLPPREGYLDARLLADGRPAPVLHGFSPYVVEPAPDWPRWVHTTGFWDLPAPPGWDPPRRLLQFLAAGDKPVFIGFSSMSGGDPGETGRTVLEAVRLAGVRAVVGTGWGGITLTDPPDDVLVESDIPYDWLFPRVRAAVHAGGPGTNHAAAVAGVPQVMCPFHKDQMMWSARMHELGVAPEPIGQRDLTAGRLAAAIRQALTDPGIAAGVLRTARAVRAEDGAGRAVEVIESWEYARPRRVGGSGTGSAMRERPAAGGRVGE